jgi:hemerythrin-like domain-containing protein
MKKRFITPQPTNKPSHLSKMSAKPWADTPFTLLPIPGQPNAPTSSNPGILSVAIEMANVHNTLLRGLNSIYLQSPHITQPADIADLLFYTKAWADTVHHHHALEEAILFPRIRAIAKEAGGLMDANVDQHHAFEGKMGEMVKFVEEVQEGKQEFDSKMLIALIDSFAPVLTQHLHDEIGTLLALENCDGEKVKQAMADTAQEGLKTADSVCYRFSRDARFG